MLKEISNTAELRNKNNCTSAKNTFRNISESVFYIRIFVVQLSQTYQREIDYGE